MSYKRKEFLNKAALDDTTLEIWLSEEWIIPLHEQSELRFTEGDVARALLIRELERDIGVNAAGIGVALHLLDQLHGLRQALASMSATRKS